MYMKDSMKSILRVVGVGNEEEDAQKMSKCFVIQDAVMFRSNMLTLVNDFKNKSCTQF